MIRYFTCLLVFCILLSACTGVFPQPSVSTPTHTQTATPEPPGTPQFDPQTWAAGADFILVYVQASDEITRTMLIDDLARVYHSPGFTGEQVVPALVGQDRIDALLNGDEARLYFVL